jgi:hypothetical protein
MTIASLLQARLANDEDVEALVSTRVYPLLLPQKPVYEAITYQRISSSGQDGTSDRKESRWQINCWAEHAGQAYALAGAVKASLEEWHEVDETPGVSWARVVNELDDYDDESKVYRIIVDVILHTTGD